MKRHCRRHHLSGVCASERAATGMDRDGASMKFLLIFIIYRFRICVEGQFSGPHVPIPKVSMFCWPFSPLHGHSWGVVPKSKRGEPGDEVWGWYALMGDSKTPACHCQAKLLPTAAGEYIFGQLSWRGPLVVVLFMASTHIRMPARPRNSPGTLFSSGRGFDSLFYRFSRRAS